MTTIVLEHPRDDARTIVKASMERMDEIDAYTDEGQRIVGQQEASLMGGNGARLIVEIPEMQADEDQTVLEVSAQKEVPIDMATNPEDITSEFLDVVNHLRERDVEDLLAEMSREMAPADSKEVASSNDFGDAQSAMGKRFVVTFLVLLVFSLFFGIVMMAMLLP